MEARQGYALWKASGEGQFDVVQRLLNDCQGNPTVVNYQDLSFDNTPLHQATLREHIAVMELLLSHGANIDIRNGEYGYTPLMEATQFELIDTMEVLLRYGAKIEAKGDHGFTPLILASMNGAVEASKVLLCHGANVNAEDFHGVTPLLHAIRNQRIGAVEILLSHGATVDSPKISDQDTALISAVRNWDTSAMEEWLLRNRHYFYPARNAYRQGETLLQWAMRNREYHFMNLLFQHGADIEARDSDGRTPLGWASQEMETPAFIIIKAMKVLLRNGAQVDARDHDGMTPLALASQGGNAMAVKILLEHGASIHLKDEIGQVPLDHALIRLCPNQVEHDDDLDEEDLDEEDLDEDELDEDEQDNEQDNEQELSTVYLLLKELYFQNK